MHEFNDIDHFTFNFLKTLIHKFIKVNYNNWSQAFVTAININRRVIQICRHLHWKIDKLPFLFLNDWSIRSLRVHLWSKKMSEYFLIPFWHFLLIDFAPYFELYYFLVLFWLIVFRAVKQQSIFCIKVFWAVCQHLVWWFVSKISSDWTKNKLKWPILWKLIQILSCQHSLIFRVRINLWTLKP